MNTVADYARDRAAASSSEDDRDWWTYEAEVADAKHAKGKTDWRPLWWSMRDRGES